MRGGSVYKQQLTDATAMLLSLMEDQVTPLKNPYDSVIRHKIERKWQNYYIGTKMYRVNLNVKFNCKCALIILI